MEFRKADIRTWSMLGQRGTFGSALEKIGSENEKIIALSADLCNTSGLDRFAAKFPQRFINTGIAEQSLVGTAAGLADAGELPFATTFANFAALRACEQVRHFMGYMKCNVKLVGLAAGFAMEYFGNSHYGIEDVAAIRAIPNIVILSPADGMEVVKCVEAAAFHEGPVYIRLTGGMNQPVVHKEDFDFKIGSSILLKEGKDIAVFATGSMVSQALKASELLEKSGISVSVRDIYTLKPFDRDVINFLATEKMIVTVEEHSIIGGLGSTVAEALSSHECSPPLLRLGAGEGYIKAGDYSYMLEQHGLTAVGIAHKILEKYQEVHGNE
ncbi:1-deoxy-D-xylulose-5-phosphate synthase [Lachnospiraceae bacterium]|nr:1-deoxy-D-xylulose-5-phosphate synthase [Lachnospiraceae bacterium]